MFPDLIPANTSGRPPPPARHAATPALFSPSERAERRFWEFFTAHIPNTRLAYLAAVRRFAEWCERRGLALDQVEPMVVAAYVEQLSRTSCSSGYRTTTTVANKSRAHPCTEQNLTLRRGAASSGVPAAVRLALDLHSKNAI